MTLVKILESIEAVGGEIFVVGGPIRDLVLNKKPKDIDFLVRKLTLDQITEVIKKIGKAGEVGQAFGIVKGIVDGQEFDFAIPRVKEIKTGTSHTDFSVQTDPNASIEDDLGRRDFTCNAMCLSLRDFINNDISKIIDPFHGLKDIHNGIIRAVGNPHSRFKEDPLRMLRCVQFSTRMGFGIHKDTFNAIIELAGDLKTVSGERIFDELKKAWTKGNEDIPLLVGLLKATTIGKVVFGSSFDPMPIRLDLQGEDKIVGMFVSFFFMGGDFMVMKPDTTCIKVLELARNIHSNSNPPHSFIGNLKDKLHILLDVFSDDERAHERICKMMKLPITAKELSVNGDDIIALLHITSSKEGKKIGIMQRKILDAIWNEELTNDRDVLIDFIKSHA